MNKIELENKILNEILTNRQDAEHLADVRYFKALQNKDFDAIDKEIRALIIEKAKLEFEGKSTAEVDESIKTAKAKRAEVLQKMGMTLQDIRPNYSCKLCNDTGFVDNVRCSCFQTRLSRALFQNSNMGKSMTHTFKDFDPNIYDKPEFGEKMLKLGQKIVESEGNFSVPVIIIRGEVGAGKSFFLECVANELLNRNVAVCFMPAFELSQNLLEWHLGAFDTKNLMQQIFIDCDVLILDDLGTEPIYQNISLEYMQNIIDVRIMKNKLTIISTNLHTEEFMERYGDRLASRLVMSSNALKLDLANSDLRKRVR